MASALILGFTGIGGDEYASVNRELGIDMHSGSGNWPDGLITHAAGPTEDGGWLVTEVWESRAAQAAFMNDRLGPALHRGGVTSPPSRVEWVDLVAFHTPGVGAAATA